MLLWVTLHWLTTASSGSLFVEVAQSNASEIKYLLSNSTKSTFDIYILHNLYFLIQRTVFNQ